MNDKSELTMQKFIEIIERWKFGDIVKSRVDENLEVEPKFMAYQNLVKEQLYLYEANDSRCIFEKKRQYYAARQMVRKYSSIAKEIRGNI